MNVMGLDYSSSCCGWGVINLNTDEIHYGAFDFKDYDSKIHGVNYWGYLLRKIRFETLNLMTAYQPNIVLIEEIFDRKMPGDAFKTLARAWASAELAAYEYSPSVVLKYKYAATVRSPYGLSITAKTKKDMLASGITKSQFEKEKKRIIVDYVNKRWGLNLELNAHDTADAILSATYLYDIEKGKIEETLYRREAKKKEIEDKKLKRLADKEQKIKEREAKKLQKRK